MEIKEFKSKKEIKYSTIVEFEALLEEHKLNPQEDDFFNFKMLQIFYGMTYDDVRLLTLAENIKIVNNLVEVLQQPCEFHNIITVDGIDYGFIPNYANITTGELIDLDDRMNAKDYFSMISILYRPIKGKINKKGQYLIEDYKGYDPDLFKGASAHAIEGCLSLFTRSIQTLSQTIPTFSK